MCAGAMLLARLGRLVWGAPNKRAGADGSWVALLPPEGFSARPEPCRSDELGRQGTGACGASFDTAHEPCDSAGSEREGVINRSAPAGPSCGQTAGTGQGGLLQGGAASSAGDAESRSRRGGWPAAIASMLRAALSPKTWLAGAPAHDSRAAEARGAGSGAVHVEGPHHPMLPAGRARGTPGGAAAGADLHRAGSDAADDALVSMAAPLGPAGARRSDEAAGSGAQRRAAEGSAGGGVDPRPWRPHPTHPTLQVRRTVNRPPQCSFLSSLLLPASVLFIAADASVQRANHLALQQHDRSCGASQGWPTVMEQQPVIISTPWC